MDPNIEAVAHRLRPFLATVAEAPLEAKPFLGVICGHHVFSHTELLFGLPNSIFDTRYLSVRRVMKPAVDGWFQLLHASTLNVCVLAPDSLHCITSEDDGPTSDCWNFLNPDGDLLAPELKPARILFRDGRSESVVDGFCFSRDGSRVLPAKVHLHECSEVMHLEIEAFGPDFFGGPIFSSKGQLLGICSHQSPWRIPPLATKNFGTRLDMCLPPVIQQRCSWDEFWI